jgi:signal transduction histidine kinase
MPGVAAAPTLDSVRRGDSGRGGGSTAALVRVLIGRDEAPQWRSAARRRLAYAAAWGCWALLAASSLGAVLAFGRQNGHGPGSPSDLGWLAVVLAVCSAIPVAVRYPLLGWRIAYLGVLVTPLIPGQSRADGGMYAVLAITFVVVSLRYGAPVLWWTAILALIPIWLWTGPDWAYPAKDTGGLAVLTVALYGAGHRDRLALAAQAREARRQAEEARQHRERSVVLEERARIAREMHDVVAHHMSMIAVQAETAPYRIAGLPDSAQAEFAALSQAAREALTDMRRLLGVLRSADEPQRLPQPGLADLPALIDSARRAGAEVTLDLPDRDREFPPVIALTAYRIVQESLSNAGRHAPGAPIRVAVREEAGCVRVNVDNGPAPASALTVPNGTVPNGTVPNGSAAPGHGLAGMRERVALVGGRLRVGPEADGGFTVLAELPVGGS